VALVTFLPTACNTVYLFLYSVTLVTYLQPCALLSMPHAVPVTLGILLRYVTRCTKLITLRYHTGCRTDDQISNVQKRFDNNIQF
jgi:hypothetical protein